MPLRGGELVGQAYVRIYADGSEVPGDIRRSMEEAEPSVREAGREHGKQYAEEFDKESKKTFKTQFGDTKKSMFHDLNEGLTESLARIELSKRFFDGREWKKFQNRLEQEFGAAGRLAGSNLERQFRDSTDLEGLAARMRDIGVEVRKAQAEILDATAADEHKARLDMDRDFEESMRRRTQAWAEMLSEAYDMNRKFDHNWRRMIEDQDKTYDLHISRLREIDQEAHRERVEQQTEAIRLNREFDRQQTKSLSIFRDNLRKVTDEIDRLEKGEGKIGHSRLQDMVDSLRRLAPSLSTSEHELNLFNDRLDVLHRRLDRSNPVMDRFEHAITRTGDGMGRLFGKGSRNNFLNFFGSVVGGVIKIGTIIPKTFGFVTRSVREVQDAFTSAGGGIAGTFSAFLKSGSLVGGVFAKAGAGIAAFAGFLVLLGLVIGPIVAILSALVGIVTALAGSLVMGAIGALAGFLPLIVPLGALVAGIVATVYAINTASDSSPRLVKAIKGIKEEAKGLWDVFRDRALARLPEMLEAVRNRLKGLDGVATAAGKGFNRAFGELVESFDGPAWDKFFDRFERFLPSAEKRLGSIFANLGEGLAGTLRAAVPLANRLLDYLDDITGHFADWANSTEGQKSITKFLDDAGDSAASFGDFLEGAWNWLWKVIRSSKSEGDNLWERIGGKFQKWADYIDAHPDQFKDWMKDADKMATSIGHLVDGLNHLIDSLDSPRNREVGNSLVDAIGPALSMFGSLLSLGEKFPSIGLLGFLHLGDFQAKIASFGDWLGWFFSTLGSGVWYVLGGAWVEDLWHGIQAGFEWFTEAVSTLVHDTLSSLASFGSGGGGAMVIKPSFDVSSIAGGVAKVPGLVAGMSNGVVRSLSGLASRVGNAVSGAGSRVLNQFNGLPASVGTIVGNLVGKFNGLPARVVAQVGSVGSTVLGKFQNIVDGMPAVITGIVNAFAGLAGKILAMIGPIIIHPTLGSVLGGGSTARKDPVDMDPDSGSVSQGSVSNAPQVDPFGYSNPATSVIRMLDGSGSDTAANISSPSQAIKTFGDITVITPSGNPRAVAAEVVNELIGAAL